MFYNNYFSVILNLFKVNFLQNIHFCKNSRSIKLTIPYNNKAACKNLYKILNSKQPARYHLFFTNLTVNFCCHSL